MASAIYSILSLSFQFPSLPQQPDSTTATLSKSAKAAACRRSNHEKGPPLRSSRSSFLGTESFSIPAKKSKTALKLASFFPSGTNLLPPGTTFYHLGARFLLKRGANFRAIRIQRFPCKSMKNIYILPSKRCLISAGSRIGPGRNPQKFRRNPTICYHLP